MARLFAGFIVVHVGALWLGLGAAAAAQAARDPSASDGVGNAAMAPAPAQPVVRNAEGRITVEAVGSAGEIHVDGRLDEAVYASVPPVSGFIQQEPNEGAPATEQTDVWVMFDDRNLYITARCWDSQSHRIVANEMRRDNWNIGENDNFAVILDTFLDRRNGMLFRTNPVGGIQDALITDGGETNRNWDTVWDVRTSRFDKGWALEMVIPFRSLRYRGAGTQVWGINFHRNVAWRNEQSFWSSVGRAWRREGINKVSLAGTLVGVEIPKGSRNVEIKPYALGGALTDRAAEPPRANDFLRDIGGDAKYGLTKGVTLDLTINTDFAQIENDEQQVNLSRFSLFYPEKRDFFLEGQTIFSFAGVDGHRGDTPLLFFSRRIGIAEEDTVPIQAGGRVSGRAGPYSIGALAIRQEASSQWGLPATLFTVGRIKRDIGRRNSLGLMVTHRSDSESGVGDNLAAGVDGSFWLSEALSAGGYYARTDNGDDSSGASYRGLFDFTGDRIGLAVDFLNVDPAFEPEVGYVRRQDIRRMFGRGRYTQRPASLSAFRRVNYGLNYSYYSDTSGLMVGRDYGAMVDVDLDNGDRVETNYRRTFERVDEAFTVADIAEVPAGDYTMANVRLSYEFGPQRPLNGDVGAEFGTYYGGTRRELNTDVRVEITPLVSVEPRLQINWIDIPVARFRTMLVGTRLNITFSPRILLASLLQYNTASKVFDANVRFHWEFTPGSDLYVVYSEGRESDLDPSLRNRSFVVKVAKLFRF